MTAVVGNVLGAQVTAFLGAQVTLHPFGNPGFKKGNPGFKRLLVKVALEGVFFKRDVLKQLSKDEFF